MEITNIQGEKQDLRIFTLDGIDYIHITAFAHAVGRSVQSTRRLLEEGNIVRPMKFYRDRSRLMIPQKELFGYPFHMKGVISHYKLTDDNRLVRCECVTCTVGDKCLARASADALIVPEGDA